MHNYLILYQIPSILPVESYYLDTKEAPSKGCLLLDLSR